MAEAENIFTLSELGLDEEETDASSVDTQDIIDNTEEKESSNVFSLAELGLEEEEVVPTTTTSETTKSLDPKELYKVADDQQYAIDSYGEESSPGVQKPKTYDEFIKDERFLSTADKYMTARFGKDGGRQLDESAEDFTDRFIEHYRNVNMNTLDLMGQVDWVRSANDRDKANYGAVFRDIEQLPSFYSEGGTGWFDGIADYGAALLTDPLTYLGLGTGAVAKMGATQAVKKVLLQGAIKGVPTEAAKSEAKKQSFKLGLKASAKPLAVETAAGVGEGVYFSEAGAELDYAKDMRDTEDATLEENIKTGLLVGGLGLTLGGIGAVTAGATANKAATKSVRLQQEARDRLVQKMKAAKREQLIKEGKDVDEAALDAYDPIIELDWEESVRAGRQTLDRLDPLDPNAKLTQESLQPEIQKRVAQITLDVLKEIGQKEGDLKAKEFLKPYLAKNKKDRKRATQAIAEVLANLTKEGMDIVDQDFLDGAIARAGLTQKQFAEITITTASEAGKTLNASSPIGKYLKGLRTADPEIKKLYEEKFGKANAEVNFFGKAHDIMMRLDRERRALMVTQLATTVRNVATGVMRIGFEGGANLIESSLYNLGRGVEKVAKGEFDGLGRGINNIFRDTFDVVINIANSSESKDLTQDLLKYNPNLLRQMDRSLQEVDAGQTLSGVTRGLNYLNMAQDRIFRKAVFTASLDKRLRRIGTNVREVIASNKPLPSDMLRDAVEDSLHFTFARTPKKGGDKPLDNIGSLFVKGNEALGPLPGLIGLPIGTGAFPYARFMVNAMQFNLQYQPFNALGGLYTGTKGIFNVLKDDVDIKKMGYKQIAEAREDMAKGVVGTAAFVSAIHYRMEEDRKAKEEGRPVTKWYEYRTEDGRPADLRPFFPLAPYLMIGELFAKAFRGELTTMTGKEALEGYTGAVFRGGSSAYLIDNIFKAIGSEEGVDSLSGEMISERVSGYVGELTGGLLTPVKMVTDIEAAFDKDASYVRDTKRIEGFGGFDRAGQMFKNQATRNMPFLAGLTDKVGQAVFGTDLSQQSLPKAESATRTDGILRQGTIVSQLTGARTIQKRNPVEEELAKMGIENWEVVPTTGDKAADAYIKRILGKYTERYLTKDINSNYYKKLTGKKKSVYFKGLLAEYRKEAKEVAEDIAYSESKKRGKKFTPFDRAEWKKLSVAKRAFADEYYMEKYGKTVMEMQEEEPDRPHLAIGKEIGTDLYNSYKP